MEILAKFESKLRNDQVKRPTSIRPTTTNRRIRRTTEPTSICNIYENSPQQFPTSSSPSFPKNNSVMQAKPASETDFQVRTNFHGNNKFTIKEDHFKPYSKHHLDLGALVNMLDETDIYPVGDNNDKSKLSIAPVEQTNKTPTNSTHNNLNKAQTVPDLIKYGKMHEENNSNLHDIHKCHSHTRMSSHWLRKNLELQQQQVFPTYNGLRPNFSEADFKRLSNRQQQQNMVIEEKSPTLKEIAKTFFLGASPPKETSEHSSSVDSSIYMKREQEFSLQNNKVTASDETITSELDDYSSYKSTLDSCTCILDVAQLHTSFLYHQYNDQVDQQKRYNEKLLLLTRCLRVLNSTLHTFRNKVQAGLITPDSTFKKLITDVNNLYKFCAQLSKETTNKCDTFENTNFKCAPVDSVILDYAVQQCEDAIIDEEISNNLHECVLRYEKSLHLIHAVINSPQKHVDCNMVYKYKSQVQNRLREARNSLSSNSTCSQK